MPLELWHNTTMDSTRPFLIHMVAEAPTQISFTFAAADGAEAIADSIGDTFDALLATSRRTNVKDRTLQDFHQRAQHVDYRLLANSAWGIVDDTTLHITIFGAGGGVHSAPAW